MKNLWAVRLWVSLKWPEAYSFIIVANQIKLLKTFNLIGMEETSISYIWNYIFVVNMLSRFLFLCLQLSSLSPLKLCRRDRRADGRVEGRRASSAEDLLPLFCLFSPCSPLPPLYDWSHAHRVCQHRYGNTPAQAGCWCSLALHTVFGVFL